MFYRKLAAALGAGALAALSSPSAWACSTCKCGDYTINLFGTEKSFENRLRVGVDYLYRSEAQGDPALSERQTDEHRVLLGLSYSPLEDLSLALQIPFVDKVIRDSNLARQTAQGLGDIDLLARWTLYRQGAFSGSHLAGLRFGLRLPTTEQVKDGNGQRMDIDVQPDAGALAPNIGAWYLYSKMPWMFTASATYFVYGDGHQGFSPGDSLVLSTLAQYAVTPTTAVQLGLDTRYAEKNKFSSVVDPDSGGTLAMAFGGVAVRVFEELIVNAGVQWRVADDLNGHQKERAIYRVGLTYDFSFGE